ncbi:MAG: hypothetical protein FGM34_05155 [Solirubrobacteraceae bacterium]|nr:hypothetical protein [Solirubrobacteraceae bacterium]
MSIGNFLITASETEVSTEIPFFIIGGVFALWALLVGGLGTARVAFPGSKGATAAICGVSVLLAAVAMTTIIIVTS